MRNDNHEQAWQRTNLTAEQITSTEFPRAKKNGWVDPLLDRDCAQLDGNCNCETKEDCKYLSEHLQINTGHQEPPPTTG